MSDTVGAPADSDAPSTVTVPVVSASVPEPVESVSDTSPQLTSVPAPSLPVSDVTSSQPDSAVEVVDNDDDPSFELGPEVELDVDIARFPPDDAGVGGAPGTSTPNEPGNDPAASGWAGFDQYLESVLIRPGNTSASVAVSIGGDVVHRAAFGLRNPPTADPAGVEDRFRIASISKTITAIVSLQLVEDGTVGLDEPIGQIVADHVGADISASTAGLTLRQLLTHTSGFGKYQSTFFRGGAADCADAARQGLGRGASGGGYVYSNMNYCIAGELIEALTGLGYERAVYQYLLTPLGISGMRLAPTIDPGPDEAQHVTTPGRNYMETLGAAGAWIATPSDLLAIFGSLDVSTPGFKPLPLERVLAMASPAGGQLGQRGYGFGVISYGNGRFGHTGTIESTHAMLLNRGDGVTWALTVAGQSPSESTDLERLINNAFIAGGFVT